MSGLITAVEKELYFSPDMHFVTEQVKTIIDFLKPSFS